MGSKAYEAQNRERQHAANKAAMLQFLNARCVQDADATTPVRVLFEAYQSWREAENRYQAGKPKLRQALGWPEDLTPAAPQHVVLTRAMFSYTLIRMGAYRRHTAKGTTFDGIRLAGQ
jgi:hypothetical protein